MLSKRIINYIEMMKVYGINMILCWFLVVSLCNVGFDAQSSESDLPTSQINNTNTPLVSENSDITNPDAKPDSRVRLQSPSSTSVIIMSVTFLVTAILVLVILCLKRDFNPSGSPGFDYDKYHFIE